MITQMTTWSYEKWKNLCRVQGWKDLRTSYNTIQICRDPELMIFSVGEVCPHYTFAKIKHSLLAFDSNLSLPTPPWPPSSGADTGTPEACVGEL